MSTRVVQQGIMNPARLKSSMSYYEVSDSYGIPEVLRRARSRFDLYGLPISSVPETPPDVHLSQKQVDEDDQFLSTISSCTGIFQMALHRFFSPFRRLFSMGNGGSGTAMDDGSSRAPRLRNLDIGIGSSPINIDIESNQSLDHPDITDINICQNQLMNRYSNSNCKTEQLPSCFEPNIQTYQIEPELGIKMGVIEIGLAYKKTVFENFLAERQDMKSLVLSTKCACLIWIWSETTRIVVITESNECGGKWSLKQWYSKILSDMALTDSVILGHPYYWHPVVRQRLHRAILHFKKLYESLSNQVVVASQSSKTATSLTKCPSTNEFLTTMSSISRPRTQVSTTTSTLLTTTVTATTTKPPIQSGKDEAGVFTDSCTQVEYVNPQDRTKVIVSKSKPSRDKVESNDDRSQSTYIQKSESELSTVVSLANEMYLKWSDYSSKFKFDVLNTTVSDSHPTSFLSNSKSQNEKLFPCGDSLGFRSNEL